MISKIDQPKIEGSKVYDNKGSAGALVNYLVSSDEKVGGEALFFNLDREDISAAEAQKMIDNNVKGLRAEETKFISMTINPSGEELKHIGNNKEKLKLYVKAAMNNYAANFKKENPVLATELVWNAIIHEHRYFTNSDKVKFEKEFPDLKFQYRTEEEVLKFYRVNHGAVCPFEKEARKPGSNMHAHVIVSKRDAAMKQTLSPHGKKETFSIVNFQRSNQETFQKMFDFRRGQNLYKEMQMENISRIINDINDRKASFVDPERIFKIAEKGEWNINVLSNVKQLNMDLYRSKNIEDPYRYLEIGSTLYWKENNEEKKMGPDFNLKPQNNSSDEFLLLSGLIRDIDNMTNDLQAGHHHKNESKNYTKRKKRRPNIE